MTSDYQLGFGSFSDKPTPPFSSELSYYARAIGGGTRHALIWTGVHLKHRDFFDPRKQPPPYSFRHQLRLTKDVSSFQRGVEDAELAGNIDSREAGMDALMQAITCEGVIGREKLVSLFLKWNEHLSFCFRLEKRSEEGHHFHHGSRQPLCL